MELLLILLAGVHLAGVLIVFLAAAKAPMGYEDEHGFHPREE